MLSHCSLEFSLSRSLARRIKDNKVFCTVLSDVLVQMMFRSLATISLNSRF